jgi:NAD(P)-dependent dehydrogenase (short-subunit alcohol dehydrogenase family)
MMQQGWGRIVDVTTSLGTAGSPTYGPSKAALEALVAIMAKDLDGTGVTVNDRVSGGQTNIPMISDAAGFNWDTRLPPEEAAESAGAPVAWTSIATMSITPSRS